MDKQRAFLGVRYEYAQLEHKTEHKITHCFGPSSVPRVIGSFGSCEPTRVSLDARMFET